MLLYVQTEQLKETTLLLSDEQFHYLSRVRRLKTNETLKINIENQTQLTVKMTSLIKNMLQFTIINSCPVQKPIPEITLIQCCPKQDKMSQVLDSGTQIGIAHFVPVTSERSIVQYTEKDKEKKEVRWQKMIEQAASQSQTGFFPSLEKLQSLDNYLDQLSSKSFDYCLVPWEEASDTQSLIKFCRTIDIQKKRVAILIGPEGGLTSKEIEKLKKKSFHSVSLGPNILRTEIAGLVATTTIQTIYQ